MADVGPGNPPDAGERTPALMDRRLRASQPAALPLEGRILLARVHVPIVPPTTESSAASLGSVWFKGVLRTRTHSRPRISA